MQGRIPDQQQQRNDGNSKSQSRIHVDLLRRIGRDFTPILEIGAKSKILGGSQSASPPLQTPQGWATSPPMRQTVDKRRYVPLPASGTGAGLLVPVSVTLSVPRRLPVA